MRLFPSRRFTGASPKGGLYAPFSQTPTEMTFVCWVKPSTLSQLSGAVLMAVSDSVGSIGDYHSVNVESASRLGCTSVHTVGTSKTAYTTIEPTPIQAGAWQLMIATFGIPGPRQIFLGPDASALDSQPTSPVAFNRLSIGHIAVMTAGSLHWFTGDIALPTVLSRIITATERASLLAGTDPRTLPGVIAGPDLTTLADSFLGATWQAELSMPGMGDQIDLDMFGSPPPPPPPPPSPAELPVDVTLSVPATHAIHATNNTDGTVTLTVNSVN